MYYPIIRGRQYDLLALRELKSKGLLSEKIIPIIEPIKLSSTLTSTIQVFEKNKSNLIVISNPKVGSLMKELSIKSVYEQYMKIMLNDYVIIGHNFNRKSKEQIENLMGKFNTTLDRLVIIHFDRNLLNYYREIYLDNKPQFNVIPLDNAFKRQFDGEKLIGADDKFNKLTRNADYLDNEVEFFSEEHLYFRKDGYIGFSDYSVIGAEYNDNGFAPYAVAIHIVYPNSENGLEIRHFVSDSNDDTSDPAGKFFEALEKLITWYESHVNDIRMNTLAMRIFKQHYKDGTYPGLPTIKKLSVMHHLELMGNLLN